MRTREFLAGLKEELSVVAGCKAMRGAASVKPLVKVQWCSADAFCCSKAYPAANFWLLDILIYYQEHC